MRNKEILERVFDFFMSETFDIMLFYSSIWVIMIETIEIIKLLAKGSNDGLLGCIAFFALAAMNIEFTRDTAFRYFPLNKIHFGRKKAGEHKHDRKEKESTMKNIVKIKMEMLGQKRKFNGDAIIAGLKDGEDIEIMMAGMINITETLAMLTIINKSTIEVLAGKIEEDENIDEEFKQELLKQLDKFKVEYSEVFERMAKSFSSSKMSIENKGRGDLFEERPE